MSGYVKDKDEAKDKNNKVMSFCIDDKTIYIKSFGLRLTACEILN